MEKQWEVSEGLSQRQSCGITGRQELVCPTDDGRQTSIGQHQFSVVPRSLFANDRKMFNCSMKSALVGILKKTGESLDTSRTDDSVASSAPSTMTVAIIDGMVELQSLDKPHWVSNCEKLAKHF